MRFAQFLAEESTSLKFQLMSLRTEFIKAAQHIYDEWEQNDDGEDDEYGGGGICDTVAQEIQGIIAGKLKDVEMTDGGHDGDDHAWTVCYNDTEAYGVDIPPHVYEIGGGYSWEKRPGVTFHEQDVVIFKINRKDIDA